MANIVISRIQHRRGRRENLPQPLLPAEVALTSDTNQAWIGQDPLLAVASVNVYSDQLETTAQTILDNNIVEVIFNESFNQSIFTTVLVPELTGTPVPAVVLTDADILWDSTFRGVILGITTITLVGSGYTTGDAITAVSSTGTGFTGTLIAAAGAITGVTVTSGGSNYHQNNTTFVLAGGTGGEINLVLNDVHGTSAQIAADPNIDALNTVANVGAAVDAITNVLVANNLISTPVAFSGTFASNSLLVNNHIEAANLATLINRVNATTPGQITGLVFTNLNIELTGGTDAGATVLPYEAGFYFEGLILGANALKVLHVTTQDVTFVSGVASEAYANVVSTAEQIYDIQKNGVSFGSVTFAIGVNIGTVSIGASTSFAKGDRLEIFGPALPDGVLDEISITLTGTITV